MYRLFLALYIVVTIVTIVTVVAIVYQEDTVVIILKVFMDYASTKF